MPPVPSCPAACLQTEEEREGGAGSGSEAPEPSSGRGARRRRTSTAGASEASPPAASAALEFPPHELPAGFKQVAVAAGRACAWRRVRAPNPQLII